MKNLKITKVLLSLFLALGLTTSSFAMGPGHKPPHDKGVTVVKVYNEHPKHHKHHKHHVEKTSSNNNDLAIACVGAGLCLALISAISS